MFSSDVGFTRLPPAQERASINQVQQLRRRAKLLDLIVFVLALVGLFVNLYPLGLWYLGYINGLPRTTHDYGGVYAMLLIPVHLTSLMVTFTRVPAIHHVAIAFRALGTVALVWTAWCAVRIGVAPNGAHLAVASVIMWTQIVGAVLSVHSLLFQAHLAAHRTAHPYL